MKFSQLAIGQHFMFDGEIYNKINPIMAVHTGTGKQKMIPRFAQVELSGAASGEQAEAGLVSVSVVAEEFDHWFQECRSFIGDSIDEGRRQQVLDALDKARQQFVDQLQVMQS